MIYTWCPVCKKNVEMRTDDNSLLKQQKKAEVYRCKVCDAQIFQDCSNQQQYLKKWRNNKLSKRLKLIQKTVWSIIEGPLAYILGALLMLILLLYLMSVFNG